MTIRPPRPSPYPGQRLGPHSVTAPTDSLLRRRHRFYRHLLVVSFTLMATLVLPGRWSFLIFPGYLLLTAMVMVELGGAVGGGDPRPVDRSYRWLGAGTIVILLYWLLAPAHVPRTGLLVVGLVGPFYLWTLVRLVGWLAQEPQVSRRVLSGALAGYLLLGICGGLLLCVVESLDPGSFRSAFDGSDPMMRGGSLDPGSPLTLTWEQNFMRVNYFAFVSLTTVGYGDIIPVRPLAQMGSLLLSVAGPLYIAVVMGVLISRLTSSWERRNED